jgi:hypothetical protein
MNKLSAGEGGVIYGQGAMGIACAGGCGALKRQGRRTVRGKGSNIRKTRTYALTAWTCPSCCNRSRVALAKAKAKLEQKRTQLINEIDDALAGGTADIDALEKRFHELVEAQP